MNDISGGMHGLPQNPSAKSLPIASSRNPQARGGNAINIIVQHLERLSPKPGGFLPDAENQLAAFTDEFTGKLGVRAVDIANARGGTAVDIPDVIAAQKSMVENSDPLKQAWQLGVGGLAGGAGAASALALAFAPAPVPYVSVWWSAVSGLTSISILLLYRSYPKRQSVE